MSEGELYLRACEASKPYLCERKLQTLQLFKRGIPIRLDYYRVNDALWQEPEQLLAISRLCLKGAQQDKHQATQARRMRDLPNIGHQLERLLYEAGINSISSLKARGAKACWVKLRTVNKHLGLNTLFALEGALSGFHYQALPTTVKAELRDWYQATLEQWKHERRR